MRLAVTTVFATGALCALVPACAWRGSGQAAPPPPLLPAAERSDAKPPWGFSGERAFAHLEALVAIGPRVSGTPGADAARDYIRAELEKLSLDVREQPVGGAEEVPPEEMPAEQAPAEEAASPPLETADVADPPDEALAEAESSPGDAASSLDSPEAVQAGEAAGDGTPPVPPTAEAEPDGESIDDAVQGVPRIEHLTAVIPGESSDIFLLAAHFDTPRFEAFSFVGANHGASGPAVLLELARNLAQRPLPFTVWTTFLDGETKFADDAERFTGSRALADQMASDGTLDSVRVGVFFDQVGDADLRVARDAQSYRRYREMFFEAARRLRYTEAFPLSSPAEPRDGSPVAFIHRRQRRVVAISDPRFGGEESPGIYALTEDDVADRCSPESLAIVGSVTLVTVNDLATLMQKIDRFVRRFPEPEAEAAAPSDGVDPAAELPVEDPAAAPPGAGESPDLPVPEVQP